MEVPIILMDGLTCRGFANHPTLRKVSGIKFWNMFITISRYLFRHIVKETFILLLRYSVRGDFLSWLKVASMCCQCRKCACSCQDTASLWSRSFLQGLHLQEAQKGLQSRQAPTPSPTAWREWPDTEIVEVDAKHSASAKIKEDMEKSTRSKWHFGCPMLARVHQCATGIDWWSGSDQTPCRCCPRATPNTIAWIECCCDLKPKNPMLKLYRHPQTSKNLRSSFNANRFLSRGLVDCLIPLASKISQ